MERVLRPASLDEALAMLAEYPRARPVAGGTDLVVQLRDGRRRADTLLELGAVGLSGIRERDGGVEIGAATPMDAIARHPEIRRRWPGVAQAAGVIGAWPIQCRATLGGNLANASPAADTAPALLVTDALINVASRWASRVVPVDAFFLAPGRTVLGPEELITAVFLPPPPEGRRVERFSKVGPRREQIIATVSMAGRATVRGDGSLADVRLAFGAVAPTPVRARRTEEFLALRRPDPATRRETARKIQAEIAPIDDVRAPASYRRVAAAVLVDRFLAECGAIARGASGG
ncbi:MAG: FAD binding domain-containing protein [Acidobacteriota bacterium]